MFFGFLVNDFLLITNWFFAAGQNDVIFFTFCYWQYCYYDAFVQFILSQSKDYSLCVLNFTLQILNI